ncbi:MAG: hypothetical protein HDT02_03685 [Bacteroidales bacterium]|nr:hypothetical protein [Bacteroidales bacterium]
MKEILFATRKLAENAAAELADSVADSSIKKIDCIVINSFEDDDSLCYLESRSGECPAFSVSSGDEEVARFAWWEEGEPYDIRVNGNVVKTADNWSLARHIMRELDDEDNGAVDCILPNGEIVKVEEL